MTWAELVDLMTKPPRPFAAVVTERVGGVELRRATVLHDGDEGWVIDGGDEQHVTFSASSSMVLTGAGGVHLVRGRLASGGWLKCLFRGELLDLEHASCEILEETTALGRVCVAASVKGLRRDDRLSSFELVVDTVDGIIVRLERPDEEVVVEIQSLEIANPL